MFLGGSLRTALHVHDKVYAAEEAAAPASGPAAALAAALAADPWIHFFPESCLQIKGSSGG